MWGVIWLPTLVFLVFFAMVMNYVSAERRRDIECPDYIYAFGDSYTDTGNAQVELPAFFTINYPYGKSYRFPDRPNERTRYCNGRLVIDFTTQAFGFPFLEPYSRHFPEPAYKRGVNFAYSGGTAAVTTALAPGFDFQHETDNYLSFHGNFTGSQYNISTALHIVTEIGGNDFGYAYLSGQTPDEAIVSVVPRVLEAVKTNLEEMYNAGARLFVVFNIPPGGCTSYFLTLYEAKSPKDEYGCLTDYNRAFQAYNQELNATMYEYHQNWTDVKIFLYDYYSATYEIVKHPETYGFNGEVLHRACCGYGGKYNFNPAVMCGNAGDVPDPDGGTSTTFVNITKSCRETDEYVLWDGMHSTEAFYRVMARFFLTGRFMDGPDGDCLNLHELCRLDFSEWG